MSERSATRETEEDRADFRDGRTTKRWSAVLPGDRTTVDARYKRCRRKSVLLNLLMTLLLAPAALGGFAVAVYVMLFEVLMSPHGVVDLLIVAVAVAVMVVAMRAWSAVGIVQDRIHDETNLLYRIEGDLEADSDGN